MLKTNLITQTLDMTLILVITAAVFVFFIAIAILKMYKLKAENKRLMDISRYTDDVNKSYSNFKESHLYVNSDKSE